MQHNAANIGLRNSSHLLHSQKLRQIATLNVCGVMNQVLCVKICRVLALIVFMSSAVAHAEDKISISTGYLTGNTFKAMSDTSKNLYATGIIDGILLAPLYGAPKANLATLENCTEGMNGQQLVAIFNKYLALNPEVWHKSMHVTAHSAMKLACKG